jgi:RimJ/RimL family protein N-acetyltransferase
MQIDYNTAECTPGRVLIFQKYRGSGFGKAMVTEAVKFAFEKLNLSDITLCVFDFNTPAINAYKSIGFTEYQRIERARHFQNESWNLIRMKLNKTSLLYRMT